MQTGYDDGRPAFLLLIPTMIAIASIALVPPTAARADEEFSAELLAELENVPAGQFQIAEDRTAPELSDPVRLEADGKLIDIGQLSSIAHAGPSVADVDGDGDRDLLVGDFPGYFWLFENQGTDDAPQYVGRGQLQAGGEAAKTPVY